MALGGINMHDTVFSEVLVSRTEKTTEPEEKTENFIRKQLLFKIAETILRDFDKFPLALAKEIDKVTGGDRYELKLNLISDDEYKMLKKYEKYCLSEK